jgi:hypothetical protein
LRILPGAGRAHRVIFTQNDVRNLGVTDGILHRLARPIGAAK